MPYSKPTESTESVNRGIEITPKSEKVHLAAGYVATVISGMILYQCKDIPFHIAVNTWRPDGNGNMIPDPPGFNFAAPIPYILCIAAALYLVYWKIRIWWRHY